MTKYRIVQKGDQYNPQYKCGPFWCKVRDYADSINWMSKRKACGVIDKWKVRDKFCSSPEIVHKPEDLCKDCKGE